MEKPDQNQKDTSLTSPQKINSELTSNKSIDIPRSKNQSEIPPQQNKDKNALFLFQQIKESKIKIYPFYAISDIYQEQKMTCLFVIEIDKDQIMLVVYPYSKKDKKLIKLTVQYIPLEDIPIKLVSALKVNNFVYKQLLNSIKIENFDIILGFRYGNLLHLNYNNRNIKILQKLNKLKTKQSLFTKTLNYFSSSDEYYKVWIEGLVKHISLNKVYNYQYQVSNTIILTNILKQSNDMELQTLYGNINWEDSKLFQKSNNTIKHINSLKYKGFKIKDNVLIDWKTSVTKFVTSKKSIYISSEDYITIVNLQSLLIYSTIKFEHNIRNINVYEHYLIAMPYADHIYLIQMKNQDALQFCKFIGHRSYVMQTLLVNDKMLTAGSDHRITYTEISKLKTWNKVNQQKKDKKYIKIVRSNYYNWKEQPYNNGRNKDENIVFIYDECIVTKYKDVYSLGEYNNARNNLYDYGFGDLKQLGEYFCFFSLDGKIKIYHFDGFFN